MERWFAKNVKFFVMNMKKTLLAIIVCSLNEERIIHQIKNLEKHENVLQQKNIEPIFVFGKGNNISCAKKYRCVELDVEEKYTNLAKKIFAFLEYSLEYEQFNNIIKIDDDTLFNIDLFKDLYLEYDYVGGFEETYSKNTITIDLPAYRWKKQILLYPSFYSTVEFGFARGDFYILSKKAVEEIVSQKTLLDKAYEENVRVGEDQFVGYCLRYSNFTRKDIKDSSYDYNIKALQITENNLSLHPIHNNLFLTLLSKTPLEQANILSNSVLTNVSRETAGERLKANIHKTIAEFLNSKKSIGMG